MWPTSRWNMPTKPSRPVSQKTLDLIKGFEGLADTKTAPKGYVRAYKCPAGVWTIGYGLTSIYQRAVRPTDVITVAEAERLLVPVVQYFQAQVLGLVKVPVTDNQLSALVSFAFNVGLDIDADTIPEGLGDSTLLKKLNAKNYAGAAAEFPNWVWARGKKLNGLKKRRALEKALFES